jgi:hypothetical protein
MENVPKKNWTKYNFKDNSIIIMKILDNFINVMIII